MTTIKDVAERANVSIATVSRVINETGYVSPELNERVKEAISALGYQRNVLARNLRRNESLTLGVLIPDSNNPFFAEVAKGIEDVCYAQGYTVVLCNTDENAEKAESYFHTLYQHRTAGFVVVKIDNLSPFVRDLIENGYPIVGVDRPLPEVHTDTVLSDNAGGARQAVEHLLSLGHRRIGFITGTRALEPIKDRWTGVQDTLELARVELDPTLIYEYGEHSPQTGYAGAEALLNRSDPPTAIFAFNDLIAFGVMNYAHLRGISIPHQLSVVGFDDIMLASYASPSLTTVAQPRYEMGRMVAEILLNRIQGDRRPTINLILPTHLIVRRSTMPIKG